MFLSTLFLLGGSALVSAVPYAANQTHESCNVLARFYPDSVFFPGSSRYTFEDTCMFLPTRQLFCPPTYVLLDSWSTDSWMGPACVYTPSTTAMVTAGIQLLAARDVPFAIRGGGFMPVSNAANIGPEGILFSNTNMTTLNITADNSVVTVGAGIKFQRLYDFLAPLKVIVNGVRLGDVGVVGFHLGGGIGFFSYEHGVAPTTVKSFEVHNIQFSHSEDSLTANSVF